MEARSLNVYGWRASDDTFRARLFLDTDKIWECTHRHPCIREAWDCGAERAARQAADADLFAA